MDISSNIDELEPGREVMLFCRVGDAMTRVLARRFIFDNDGRDELGWQVTWDGSRLPADWEPFAYCDPQPPEDLTGDY